MCRGCERPYVSLTCKREDVQMFFCLQHCRTSKNVGYRYSFACNSAEKLSDTFTKWVSSPQRISPLRESNQYTGTQRVRSLKYSTLLVVPVFLHWDQRTDANATATSTSGQCRCHIALGTNLSFTFLCFCSRLSIGQLESQLYWLASLCPFRDALS